VTFPAGQEGGGVLTPARFAADGRAFLAYRLFGACSSFGALRLATRAPAGSWSTDELPPGMRWWEQLLVDSQQHPHIVSLAQETSSDVGLSDWQPGSAAVHLADVKPAAEDYPLAVSISGGGVAAAVRTEAGIRVVAPDGNGVLRERTVPATATLTVTGCPPIAAVGTTTFSPRPCTETGEGAVSLAGLAAPGDGAVRVAYVSTRVDRDVSQECHTDQFGLIACTWPTTADRSVSELIVARVPVDGSASSIPWRTPIVSGYGYGGMDARDARLGVAYTRSEPSGGWSVRVLLLDTTAL